MAETTGEPRHYRGRLADPVFRRERASKAAHASNSPAAAARKLVASWPRLTEQQKQELRALLAPALGGGDR